jgi:hypothetical protein
MSRIWFWGLVGLTFAVYGLMLGWSLPTISSAAGGLAPFDMRPGGYDFAEARGFLSALTADGTAFYLNVQLPLDIAYPALVALTLFFSIAATAPKKLGRWRWVPAALALPVAFFDYLENHAIALMIETGPSRLSPELVLNASQWTILKSMTTTAAITVLLVFLTLQVARLLALFLLPTKVQA